jgi:hypothetical protein
MIEDEYYKMFINEMQEESEEDDDYNIKNS